MIIDENYLYINTSDNDYKHHITKLLSSIKSNTSQRIGLDTVYTLKAPIIHLPNIKQKKETLTKWKVFAEKKGIEPRKKSFFVADEEDEEKKYHRFGALSKKNLELRGGIYKDGSSYSKLRREKLKRVKENKEKMIKNKERFVEKKK